MTILADTTQTANQVPLITRPASPFVLIETAVDGYQRAFAENANVLFVNRPLARTQEAGRQVDELIRLALPESYRKLYYPGMVRAVGNLKRLTIEQLIDTVTDLRILEAISSDRQSTSITAKVSRVLGVRR
ncbi:MAG: hypothetical protein ABL888_11245 [Pirellulaceae bacterium]